MAFTFTDRTTGEMVETDEPIRFWMHIRQDAIAAVEEWQQARLAAMSGRISLSRLKDDFEHFEADVRLSSEIDGANAETRKAQVEVVMRGRAEYSGLKTAIEQAEELVARSEATAEAAHSRYRVALRDLEVLASIYGPQESDPRGA